MKKLARAGLVILAINAVTPLSAQEAPSQNRKWLLAGVGIALLGGSAAMLPDGHDGSFCATKACLVPLGGAVGGFIGFLLGSDLDAKALAEWNPAAHLTWSNTALRIPGVPHRIASAGTNGASLVLTDRGLHHVTAGGMSNLLSGVRVLDAALLRDGQTVAAASAAGALRLPLSGVAVDTVLAGWTSTVAANSDGGMIAGQRGRLQRIGAGGTRTAADVSAAGVPLAMTFDDRGTLWVLWGSRLEARRADGLELIAEIPVDPPASSMRLHGNMIALTQPTGAVLMDISTAAAPREVARATVPFAQGVALTVDRLFAAAGERGLFVFDRAGSTLTLVGIIRDLGFVADVQVSGSEVHVLDRAGQRLLTGRADSIVVQPD